eukprot:g26130.t1
MRLQPKVRGFGDQMVSRGPKRMHRTPNFGAEETVFEGSRKTDGAGSRLHQKKRRKQAYRQTRNLKKRVAARFLKREASKSHNSPLLEDEKWLSTAPRRSSCWATKTWKDTRTRRSFARFRTSTAG